MENNNCIICNSQTTNIAFETPKSVSSDAQIIDASLKHSFCNICGYIFVNNDKRVDYEKFYIKDYDFLLDGDIEPTLDDKKYSEHLADLYSELINNTQKKTFFDIGGGKGNFVEAIHEKYKNLDIYALEPSKSFKKLKEKKFLKEKYNSFFNSKSFSGKFDYLSLISVLEHVENPKEFLLDIKKIMTKDSFLLIEVPNFKKNKSDLLTIDHLSKFTEESIINLFNICGFCIIKKQITNSVPMQFIIQMNNKTNIENIIEIKMKETINLAVNYLDHILKSAELLKNTKIAVYGQGLILDYLIGIKKINLSDIICIINDNPLYQGKKYKNQIDIVGFNKFQQSYRVNTVFLAMNDCYHDKVMNKLNKLNVFGVLK